jgi:hypothetical protein
LLRGLGLLLGTVGLGIVAPASAHAGAPVAAHAATAPVAAHAATAHAAAAATHAPATARATAERPTALLLFLPSDSDAIESKLAGVPSLSTGLMSATQGNYRTTQLLLDITQGARVSYSAYTPGKPPALSLTSSGLVTGWPQALKRAYGAPQILQPGLLATTIPGGGAYAGSAGGTGSAVSAEGAGSAVSAADAGSNHADGVIAANRAGHVAAVSLGPATSLPTRIARLSRRYSLVVADLPAGPAGETQLHLLAMRRPAQQLLLVLQRAPDRRGYELLWTSLAGLGGGHALTSSTTNQRGLIAAIDLAPTILRHLALPIPAAMRGEPVRTDGSFDGAYLRTLKARLGVVYSRRLPALAWLLVAWAVLLLAALIPIPRGDPARRRAAAMRVGALALLWTPVAELLPAALEPSRPVEYTILVLSCFLLGLLTDRLLPWPRAPLAPALLAVLALSADSLLHTQLLIRSLLGPNPIFGARFYGIGNELKSALAVLVFAAVAAVLYPAVRGRRSATAMALAGIALAVVEGSARIGAGVGGVILVSAGTAVATVMLLPGQLTRRRALFVLIAPVVGLIALAALDLLSAHGSGHFTGSILHARSGGDLRDVIERRYAAAYDELKHGAMPVATALGLLAAGFGLRARERLLAPVGGDPAWLAALAGGLTAGVVGALTEDSGPVLFVVAVFVLICLLGYLAGQPPESRRGDPRQRTDDTRRAARSRARTPPPGALAR